MKSQGHFQGKLKYVSHTKKRACKGQESKERNQKQKGVGFNGKMYSINSQAAEIAGSERS